MAVDDVEGGDSRSRPSWLRRADRLRSRLIASVRSSRSAISLSRLASTSASSSSARRLTAPSRSRSCRRLSSLRSTWSSVGQRRRSARAPASAARPAGSQSSSVCDRVQELLAPGAAPPRPALPRRRAPRAPRPSRRAPGARARSASASAVSPSARASDASLRAASAVSNSSASARRRRANSCGASASCSRSSSGRGAALGDLGDLRLGPRAPLVPRAALGGDRALRRARAPRPRARGSAPRRAPRRIPPAPAPAAARARSSAQRQLLARRERRPSPLRPAPCARPIRRARLWRATAASSTRRQPRQRLRALALEVGERVAGAVGGGAGGADARPPFGFRRRGLAQRRRRRGRPRRARLRPPARAASASRSRSPRRFFSASRRAAGVGASAAATKPSQRHRSPSRETSRWPTSRSAHQALAVGAGDDADLGEAARQRRRRGDAGGERLDAVGQRRVGADAGRAATSAPAPPRRSARRDRRRAPPRAPPRSRARRVIASTTGGNSRPDIAPKRLASVRASVSSACAARSASASGPRERASASRASRMALLGGERRLLGRGERVGELGRGLGARLALGVVGAEARKAASSRSIPRIFGLEPGETAALLGRRGAERMAARVEVGRGGLRLGELGLGRGRASAARPPRARAPPRRRPPASSRASASAASSAASRSTTAAASAISACSRSRSRANWATRRSSSASRSLARFSSASSASRASAMRCSAAPRRASSSRKAGRSAAASACRRAASPWARVRSATSSRSESSFFARLGEGRLVLPPGDEMGERVVAADVGGEIAVAARLARLALQALDLDVDLLQDVLDPQRGCPPRPFSRSSASWRREWRPEMPAASSRMSRRAWGLAAMISPIWPWRTSAGERAPVEASANRSCTSRARTSLPLTR